MTRRPSATAFGSVANRLSSSTSWATARVAELPVPIAMPMSASFRARTSLTPSPVMATTWPRACIALTIARFCCGVTRPNTVEASSTTPSRSESSGKVLASTGSSSQSPARRATAATVAGWSPEITLIVTSCAAKYANVSAASGRILSSRRTSARGVRSAGGLSPLRAVADWARSTTRRPAWACSSTRSRTFAMASPSTFTAIGRRTSGAPRNHDPCSVNATALHLRADENGIAPVACQPGCATNASRNARAVAFGLGSAAAMAPSASGTPSAWPIVSTDCTTIDPSVRVPVLSRQRMSTRASPSTAGSSCTSTFT